MILSRSDAGVIEKHPLGSSRGLAAADRRSFPFRRVGSARMRGTIVQPKKPGGSGAASLCAVHPAGTGMVRSPGPALLATERRSGRPASRYVTRTPLFVVRMSLG
jgi:hypothetical protein